MQDIKERFVRFRFMRKATLDARDVIDGVVEFVLRRFTVVHIIFIFPIGVVGSTPAAIVQVPRKPVKRPCRSSPPPSRASVSSENMPSVTYCTGGGGNLVMGIVAVVTQVFCI